MYVRAHTTHTYITHTHHRRMWQARSLACGKDITHGISPIICRYMGITPADMAGVQSAK